MKRRSFIKKTVIAGTALSAIPTLNFGRNDLKHVSQHPGVPGDILVTPQETDEILANPGVGWETFHRTSGMDNHLPSWIPSTVCYYRWGWDKFEPVNGQIDTAFFEQSLKDAHDSGQTLAFRVMTSFPGRTVYPSWLKDIGGKIDLTTVLNNGANYIDTPVPDFNDETVLESHNNFIKRLGELYDGHQDIAHVDLGSIGWWGEWHLTGQTAISLPSYESLRKVVDAYLNAFTKTPLLIPINSNRSKVLEYAISNGMGWRADCFGDMDWHMTQYYTQSLERENALEAWKKAPVAWETCKTIQQWVDEGWSLRCIFNYGIALHGTVFNNKSAVLPGGEDVSAEIKRFLQRLGYRFVLKEISHYSHAESGKTLDISMKWQNIGSAPCYKPYKLAFSISPDAGDGKGYVIVSTTTADKWMPGDMKLVVSEYLKNPVDLPLGEINNVNETITIPSELPSGNYRLSVGIIEDKNNPEPAIRLGIKGRTGDGWYPVSEIRIDKMEK